jgi:hypothetical protein
VIFAGAFVYAMRHERHTKRTADEDAAQLLIEEGR